MENCTADIIADKHFRGYWNYGKLSLCKNHSCEGLSINSCSVDVSAIKNALLKQRIYSKIPRSSHLRSSLKKGVLRNFTKFAGKHLCQSLFFKKVTGPATLLKNKD